MLKESPDKFLGRQGHGPIAIGSAILDEERDEPVAKRQDAFVADCHAEDVRRQVFECGHAVADRLKVNDPVLLPDGCGHLRVQTGFLERITDLGAEDDGKRLGRQQVVLVFGADPAFAISGKPAGRHDEVGMEVVCHVASPGLEQADKTDMSAQMPGIGREFLDSGSKFAHEDGVESLLVGACEGSEGSRERGGNQEIRNRKKEGTLFL